MDKNTCSICDKTGDYKKTKMSHAIFRCSNCGLLWQDIGSIENKEVVNYVESFENIDELRMENYNIILDNLEGLISKNAVGLEVGSACGTFLSEAAKRGLVIKGIEPMMDSFLISKQQGWDVYHGFFPQDLPELGSYDFIIFNDVFEHIPDNRAAIKACYNLINKGGILIINLPVSNGILFKIANVLDKLNLTDYLKRMWQTETESPHIFYFNSRNLKSLLVKNDFRFIKEIKMKTFKIRKLKARISAIGFGPIKATIIAFFLTLSVPLINILPNDTSCFVFKKM